MKDNEIIKALEICTLDGYTCADCPYDTVEMSGAEVAEYDCSYYLRKDVLDLINRQQAEIDRLKTEKDNLIKTYSDCQIYFLKEFTEKLEADIGDEDFYIQDKLLLMSMIEKIAKEMVGAEE